MQLEIHVADKFRFCAHLRKLHILILFVIFDLLNFGQSSGSTWQETLEILPHLKPATQARGQIMETPKEETDEWAKLKKRWHQRDDKTRYPNYVDNHHSGTQKDYSLIILADVLAGYLAGTVPKKVAMYNMKTYLPQYTRFYWIGKRYFSMDPLTTLASFITCNYSLPSFVDLRYEGDDIRVEEILFQCIKFQGTCCELNCCDLNGRPLNFSTISAVCDIFIERMMMYFALFLSFTLI